MTSENVHVDSIKMIGRQRSNSSSSNEACEESVLSDYEKRQESIVGNDEEKAIGLDNAGYSATQDGDIEPAGRGRSQRRSSYSDASLKKVRSHHSRAGGDGYTFFDAEPPNTHRSTISKPGTAAEEPYLVAWDGDADPLNPRSMTTLRRWMIVLICSASSLCVYATYRPLVKAIDIQTNVG